MNEEEVKETLKTMKENIDKKYLKTRNSVAIETVLNLLEKKDTLIHTMQSEFERLEDLEDNTDMLKMELEKKDIDIIEAKEANRQLSIELQKKDKIIDLMSEEISKSILNTCPSADYNIDLDCENKCRDDYKECWKQYFERRVEND